MTFCKICTIYLKPWQQCWEKTQDMEIFYTLFSHLPTFSQQSVLKTRSLSTNWQTATVPRGHFTLWVFSYWGEVRITTTPCNFKDFCPTSENFKNSFTTLQLQNCVHQRKVVVKITNFPYVQFSWFYFNQIETLYLWKDHWTIATQSLNYPWTIFELSLDYRWTIFELSLDYCWTIFEL